MSAKIVCQVVSTPHGSAVFAMDNGEMRISSMSFTIADAKCGRDVFEQLRGEMLDIQFKAEELINEM